MRTDHMHANPIRFSHRCAQGALSRNGHADRAPDCARILSHFAGLGVQLLDPQQPGHGSQKRALPAAL
jgi:hypothetical protein